jgi:hypothetical protein
MSHQEKCYHRLENGTFCKKPITRQLVFVQIYHPATMRVSWRTWKLCEEHLKLFWAFKGEGWHALKREKGQWVPEGILVAYSFTSKTENIEKMKNWG